MECATPMQIRQSLELAEQLKRARVRFVPIPVLDDADYVACMAELNRKIGLIEASCREETAEAVQK